MLPLEKSKPFDVDSSLTFLQAISIDAMSNEEIEKNKEDFETMEREIKNFFLIQILDKRIDVLKLPIKFTLGGYIAALALCNNPGQIVCLLIDCLESKVEIANSKSICEIYPFGFYNEKSFEERIDNELKTRKTEWAGIY